ncbi:DUF3048 domain-containing protein [Nocardioides sp. zg-579]|uniref:DUF3048 domain-containing protein n=1 Tax=Nocardioides marmotae TaxID=2663857 RepID=A0A6I3JFS0_9ACTN|nr:DUF3048 domain-containing protein [Gordonia jinghuaiqii]MTB96981.1 DUF3048 domain-containing protein [Nocardioides marmotae]
MEPAVRRTRSRALVTTLAATALVLSACGGGGGSEEDGGTDPQETSAGSTLASTWPLTGLPVKGDDSATQDHPVLVLKMDNTSSSAPQVGLGSADLVVEELVEGGMTRLAAFYYSEIPDDAGPVRSMRASDIGIVSPADAAMVTSGAAPITIKRIKGAGIEFFGEGAKGFYRASGRSAPYNLFTDMTETATLTEGGDRPADYLSWGAPEDLPKGKPASSLAASFGGAHTTSWVYRDGGYVNEGSYAADGDEFPADSVLVLRVEVGDAGYADPAGNPVPETKLEGKGEAMLFHGGRMVRGTWSKKALDAPIELSTKQGELTVPAGHTWIELVPRETGNVTFSR